MATTTVFKLMDQSRSVWTETESVSNELDEYRFSGWLASPVTLDASGVTTTTRFTCIARSGSVIINFYYPADSIRQFTVSPGLPLHIELPMPDGAGPEQINIDPGAGAHVEILTHLSDDPALADRFLWLRASEGLTTVGTSVSAWRDTRAESLAPSDFVQSSANVTTPQNLNDFQVVTRDTFGGEQVIKLDGSRDTVQMLYSGDEFTTGGDAYNVPYTLIVCAEWPDNGDHQTIFGSGRDDSVNALVAGGFFGVEGGHTAYFGAHTAPPYTWNNAGGEMPWDGPCVLVMTCDGGAFTQVIRVRLPGGTYSTFSLSGGGYFDARIKAAPYIGGAARGGAGYNNDLHVSSCWLAELMYFPRVLDSNEIEAQVARLTAQYGFEDVLPVQPPFQTNNSSLLFREGRGITTLSTTSGQALNSWYDTRLSKAGSGGGSFLVSAGAPGTILVADGVVTLGTDQTGLVAAGDASPVAGYAGTAGMSSFSMGLAVSNSNVGNGVAKHIIGTRGYGAGHGSQTYESASNYGYNTIYAAGGSTALEVPVVILPEVCNVISLDRFSSPGTLYSYLNDVNANDALAPASATADPAAALMVGGVNVSVPSASGDSITGDIHEIFYSTSYMPYYDVADYHTWLNARYGMSL